MPTNTAETMKPTYTRNIRQLSGQNLQIVKVFPPYRSGWYETTGGKMMQKTYKYFPLSDLEVLVSGTEEIKLGAITPETKVELREQIWNNGKAEFHKLEKFPDRDFYKVFKKVFDVQIKLPEDKKIIRYVKDGEEVYEITSDVILQGMSATRIKDLIRTLVDEDIPMVDGKDKLGNKARVEAYDFEDTMKEKLNGVFVKMKISGEGLDTKYVITPGKAFETSAEINIDELPF